MGPIDIGSRLELFVDDYLIEELNEAERRLHRPQPEEVAMVHDESWEGGTSLYHTILEDDGLFRMYYRGSGHGPQGGSTRDLTLYAESEDGLNWRKPDIGRYEIDGTEANNVILGPDVEGITHNFTPFLDPTIEQGASGRYKGVGSGDQGLMALQSRDGIDWSLIDDDPIFTREQGAFDSQNLVFWDESREEYRAYFRYFHEEGDDRRRAIKTSTSNDFENWSEPEQLEYPDAPPEQLYTNGIKTYSRAPHIFIGFPARYVERDPEAESMRQLPGWEELRKSFIENSGRTGFALTDTLFMSSRDGQTFDRWQEAFIRPGLWNQDSTAQWFYGDNYPAWHVIETPSRVDGKPRELSLFASEKYRSDIARLRRYSLRIDGFISVHAPLGGGEVITKPVEFSGEQLVLNYATSAAGSVRVELQKPDGTPYEGFSEAESPELFGDDLDRVVTWANAQSASELRGKPVRIRFVLSDAEIYSFQFRASN